MSHASTTPHNQHMVLAARPQGPLKVDDFALQDASMPNLEGNDVVIETHYLSLDPAMKGWIEARVDYVAPVEIGDVMRGQGGGIVIESSKPEYPVGLQVTGQFGWRRYVAGTRRSLGLAPVPEGIELCAALNVLGITGLTAYFGMLDIGKPARGDTVLISGAAGATGSVAGQLARIAGARVIGIAGGEEKCAWLMDTLEFEAAIDYKNEDVSARVAELCGEGIDVYFDNVGGDILDIALDNLAQNARVVLCGGISRYNETGPIPGPVNYFNLIYRNARMEGFIVLNYLKRFPEAITFLTQHLLDGRLKHRETITQGFEQLPVALASLFTGGNTGKALVAV
ncbi:MAG: NADP-dependent oxidoreductase [Pseudomonadota bacterium]